MWPSEMESIFSWEAWAIWKRVLKKIGLNIMIAWEPKQRRNTNLQFKPNLLVSGFIAMSKAGLVCGSQESACSYAPEDEHSTCSLMKKATNCKVFQTLIHSPRWMCPFIHICMYYCNWYQNHILSLSPLVQVPTVVREMDWVNHVWPTDLPEDRYYI